MIFFISSFETLFVPSPGNQINSFHPAGEDKEVAEGFYPLIHFLLPTFPLLTSSWELFTHTLQHDSLFWFIFEAIYKISIFCLMLLQSGIKCVIVASAMRAEQGPCEPIKGCIRKLESNSEPERARVCQRVAVRASESQSGSHRES